MTWTPKYCEDVLADPDRFIIGTFGELVTIQQDDILADKGIISFDYMRNVGFPKEVDNRMKLRGITFNTIKSPLPNIKSILEQYSLPQNQEMAENLCLNIISNSGGREAVAITYIDIYDQGTVKIWCFYLERIPIETNIIFANSSVRQFMSSLAFTLIHWKNMPTDDEFNANGLEFYEMVNDKYFKVIHELDSRAIPPSEKEWNHKSQTASYWTSFYEYLTL
jgi:hypothetical protein